MPSHRTLATLAAAAAAAVLGTAAPAAADVYEATFDVRLQLQRESRRESANFGTIASRLDAIVALRGRIPEVRFDGGRLAAGPLGLQPAGPPAEVTAATGSSEQTIGSEPPKRCAVSRAQAVGAPRLLASHDAGALRFSPLAALRLARACPEFSDTTSFSGVERDGPLWLAGPVAARVAPPAAGEARVVREVAATATLARCDREDAPDPSTRCTMAIAGTVTFTRVQSGAPAAGRAPRWPRTPRLRSGGSFDRYDNLFVYRLARVDLDARLAARADVRAAGRPAGWGELDMSLAWHRRFPGPVADDLAGWYGAPGMGRRTSGGFWTRRGQRFEWRGTAAYDRGVVERGTTTGREWMHASGACADLRWRPVGRLSATFLPGPADRVRVRVRLPGIGRSPSSCDALPIRDERLLDYLFAHGTVPASALRRRQVVIPFSGERRTRSGDGRTVRDLRIAGSVTLERDDACRNPPEYPCIARFLDG